MNNRWKDPRLKIFQFHLCWNIHKLNISLLAGVLEFHSWCAPGHSDYAVAVMRRFQSDRYCTLFNIQSDCLSKIHTIAAFNSILTSSLACHQPERSAYFLSSTTWTSFSKMSVITKADAGIPITMYVILPSHLFFMLH